MLKDILQRAKDGLLKLPLITWVLLGCFLTFLFFFVAPVFFDPSQVMQFNQYLLVLSPIGHDFRSIVFSSFTWLHGGNVPVTLYPPVTLIFFAPLTLLSYDAGYKVLLLVILACFVLITWFLPAWMNAQKVPSPFAMLVFITGIVSYGLQFELERGQWNIIAFAFCLSSIYIFHRLPKRRWLAYLLFTISVQLKLYPAIFVVALIDDPSDWKNNLKRIIALGLINIAALFLFGLDPILSTFGTFGRLQVKLDGRPYNLSIRSFATYILSLLPHQGVLVWFEKNDWFFQLLLLVFFIICFGIILWQAYKRRSQGFDPYVFMACLVGAFIIPPVSYDYKLSILPAALAFSIPAVLPALDKLNRLPKILLSIIFSLVYSSTLYTYRVKSVWLANDLPAMMVILVLCTILACVGGVGRSEPLSDAPRVDSAAQ